ncbi:MAG: RNA-binding protein [Bdellovibrionia bacterium]
MSTKLFVQNLSAAVDSWELESWFSTVGDVASASVETLNGNQRVGYVQMGTPEQAADCIDRFNGRARNGRILIVREDKVHVSPKVKA